MSEPHTNGKVSFSALGLVLTALGLAGAVAVPTVGAFFMWVQSIEDRLQEQIAREVERNNQLEREMGAVQMINNLFIAGKLEMGGPQ